jgi:hypothetical protein
MTYLEIVNEVLSRLREDTVSAVSNTTYSQLIGRFVKQAYIEASNAYEWPELDGTDDTAIAASDTSWTITTGDTGEGIFDIHSVFNVTDDCFLKKATYKWIRDKLSDDTTQNRPTHFAYGGETADGTTTLHLYPTSDGTRTLRTSYNRKPDLNNTFNDSTVILMPELPVILRAWALAISERGEDGGSTYNEVDQSARESLSDAIALYDSNTPPTMWAPV